MEALIELSFDIITLSMHLIILKSLIFLMEIESSYLILTYIILYYLHGYGILLMIDP